ncbi:MAG: hypothetical protein QOE77_3796 [Blastocatellia bacterium]|nr:hypothetical protein [Blastocatellia bacterium]
MVSTQAVNCGFTARERITPNQCNERKPPGQSRNAPNAESLDELRPFRKG